MDGDGGMDMVDAEEDPGDFENKRRSPYFQLSVGLPPYLLVYFWREKLAEHSARRSRRTPPPY